MSHPTGVSGRSGHNRSEAGWIRSPYEIEVSNMFGGSRDDFHGVMYD